MKVESKLDVRLLCIWILMISVDLVVCECSYLWCFSLFHRLLLLLLITSLVSHLHIEWLFQCFYRIAHPFIIISVHDQWLLSQTTNWPIVKFLSPLFMRFYFSLIWIQIHKPFQHFITKIKCGPKDKEKAFLISISWCFFFVFYSTSIGDDWIFRFIEFLL